MKKLICGLFIFASIIGLFSIIAKAEEKAQIKNLIIFYSYTGEYKGHVSTSDKWHENVYREM